MTLKRWHKLVLAVVLAAIAWTIAETQPREWLAFAIVPAVAAATVGFLAMEPTSQRMRRMLNLMGSTALVLGSAWTIGPWPFLSWVSGLAFLIFGGYFISVMYRPRPSDEPVASA